MHTTVSELAAMLGGTCDPSRGAASITGVASAAEADSGDLTFFGNPKYLAAIRATKATAILVPRDFQEPHAAALIAVDNPSIAFAQVVARFAPPPIAREPGIHPSAVIASDASIGEGCSIAAGAVIESGAAIGPRTVISANAYIGHGSILGADCLIHPLVTIRERCKIGARVVIHSGTVIGSDGFGYEQKDGRHVKIPQVGIVQVDDDVEIGANVTVDRARFGRTWIGEGTKIDNLVQIAHNVVIGKHCIIISQVGISGSTRIGNGVVLAGQVGIVGHIQIGDGVVVAAQSGISKSLPPGGQYLGSPAIPMREAKENLVCYNNLKKLFDRVRALEKASGLR